MMKVFVSLKAAVFAVVSLSCLKSVILPDTTERSSCRFHTDLFHREQQLQFLMEGSKHN